MELNANAGYIFYEEFMFKSYAYTGLNYARSKVDTGNDSLTDSAIGLNLGLGAEYDFGGVLAFGDLKYVISEFDQPVFSIGLRSEEHTSELQSRGHLVCRLLLEKKNR